MPRDDKVALLEYERVAAVGNAHAQHAIATMLLHGRGHPADARLAAAWFRCTFRCWPRYFLGQSLCMVPALEHSRARRNAAVCLWVRKYRDMSF